MKKNVLITGGAGFIGSHLSKFLLDAGCRLTIMDNLSVQIHGSGKPLPDWLKNHVRFIHGDVRKRSDWQSALEKVDTVVHLAAETGTGQSMYEIDRYVDVNIRGTAVLLDMLANTSHDVKKLVVASSRSVYGEGKYHCAACGIVYPNHRNTSDMEKGDFSIRCPICDSSVELMPTDENSKIHPSSVYGITKYTQEQMVLTVARSLKLSAVALRYQNVYGPGQSLSNPYTGILSIFSTRIKNGADISIFEDGTESRDFVFIDDVVRATAAAIEQDDIGVEVFNVGSGVATDVLTVAKTLAACYQSEVPIRISGNFRAGDIRHNFADLRYVQSRLGYQPKVDFPTGIRRFAEWVNTQSIAEDGFERSIEEMKSKGLYK